MRNHSNFRKPVLAAAVLASALTLTGCFPNPLDQFTGSTNNDSVEQGVGDIIDGMTGGELDVETGSTLPDDFPAEVPLVDGKLVMATGMTVEGSRSWMLAIAVDDPDANFTRAQEALLSAGFEEIALQDTDNLRLGIYQSDSFRVHLGASSDSDGPLISYQVISVTPAE